MSVYASYPNSVRALTAPLLPAEGEKPRGGLPGGSDRAAMAGHHSTSLLGQSASRLHVELSKSGTILLSQKQLRCISIPIADFKFSETIYRLVDTKSLSHWELQKQGTKRLRALRATATFSL